MTYGIEVTNPDVNRVILDGSNPLYVIPPIRVANRVVRTQMARNMPDSALPPFTFKSVDSNYNEFWEVQLVVTQEFDIQLQYPLVSIEPPLVFIRQDASGSGHWALSASSPSSWTANTVITPIGSAGRWTGVKVSIRKRERTSTAYDASQAKYHATIVNNFLRYYGAIPNLSSKFILAGHGVRASVSGYGMVIYDTSGRVVFNSDSNVAKAVGATSRWIYNNRSGGSGRYEERWQASRAAPSSSAYVLFSPYQRFRRYNGETAQVGMTSVAGTPRRIIIGGRSGSPAHTPIIWIEPMKPVEYW